MGRGLRFRFMVELMMYVDYSYLATPFLSWFVAGAIKFIVNSLKFKRFAIDLIGYGGLPSNHSAIVSSMVALIAFKEGLSDPAFGVAITLAFITMLDASSLRREVGKHAILINKMSASLPERYCVRERMGHSRLEIAVGALIGLGVAAFVYVSNG